MFKTNKYYCQGHKVQFGTESQLVRHLTYFFYFWEANCYMYLIVNLYNRIKMVSTITKDIQGSNFTICRPQYFWIWYTSQNC